MIMYFQSKNDVEECRIVLGVVIKYKALIMVSKVDYLLIDWLRDGVTDELMDHLRN